MSRAAPRRASQAPRNARNAVVAQAAAAEVEAALEPMVVAGSPEAVAYMRYLRMQPSKVGGVAMRLHAKCIKWGA